MQDLKSDTVLFLTRDGCEQRDRVAAKLLAPCGIEVRHVDSGAAQPPRVDVLIHAEPETAREAHASDAANRIENAMREACDHDVRALQWVEEGATEGPRPATAAGDATSAQSPRGRANSGLPPKHRRESQGHGSAQSPAQPGDRQINPPPNPRR